MPRLDARTSLVAGASIGATGLFGLRASLVGLVLLALFCALCRLRLAVIARRVAPLVGGLLILAVAAPFAPERALELAVRGLLMSCTAALVALVVPWTAPVGLLQALHAPRVVIAFTSLVARQIVSLGDEVSRVYRALLLRGAFDARGGRVRAARVLLVMLLPTAMERADHLADALASRGFDGRIPLPRPWRPQFAEAPLYAIVVIAAVASVWEKLPWIRSLFASTT